MKILLLLAITVLAGLAQAQNPSLKVALSLEARGEITNEAALGAFTSELLKLPYVTLVPEGTAFTGNAPAFDVMLDIRLVSWHVEHGTSSYLVINVFTSRYLINDLKAAPFETSSDLSLALSIVSPFLVLIQTTIISTPERADIRDTAKDLIEELDAGTFKAILRQQAIETWTFLKGRLTEKPQNQHTTPCKLKSIMRLYRYY